MSVMIEVTYAKPVDEVRELDLQWIVTSYEGRLDYREVPESGQLGGICLTFEFDDSTRAEAAAETLRRRGEHVEGPSGYGPSGRINGTPLDASQGETSSPTPRPGERSLL